MTYETKQLLDSFRRMRVGEVRVDINDIPMVLDDAYKIQHYLLGRGEVGAWKLGGTTEVTQRLFSVSEVYYGGLTSNEVFHSDLSPIFFDNKIKELKGEAEVCFKLSDKISELSTYDSSKLDKYIDTIAASLELPWSMLRLPDEGVCGLVADSCAAGLLVVGEQKKWQRNLLDSASRVSIYQNKKRIANGAVSNIINGPIAALNQFLLLAKQHGLKLVPGQYVATGGCTPCVSLNELDSVSVEFEGLGQFQCQFVRERK